jgi:hypothetical protein
MMYAFTSGLVGFSLPPVVRGMGAYTPAQVQQIVVQTAQAKGVPPAIALAVASHESQFQATAQNPGSSAAGVMQLMSVTQQTMGVTNPYDPTQNVDAGVSLLAQYYAKYGNWAQALQAYSDGPGTVQQGLPPSQQTVGLINYVNTFDASGILSSLGVADTSGTSSLADAFGSATDQINATVAGIDFTDPSTLVIGLSLVLGVVWLARNV